MGSFAETADFIERLQTSTAQEASQSDRPNYWTQDPTSLVTTANVHGVAFESGCQVYQTTILPAIEEAEHEVVLVTCFWARSPTLDALNESLRKLSLKSSRAGRKLTVRICFSSSSLWQKLTHSPSVNGQTYASSQWETALGLPPPSELHGLDLEVKSVFLLPFSVMHPKFVIIDRKRILLPSCNVSWEEWFEGCIDLDGPVIEQFVRFWQAFWRDGADDETLPTHSEPTHSTSASAASAHSLLASQTLNMLVVPTVFLPSPHHRLNLPWLSSERPPPTPLNVYLLTLFEQAKHDIFIQTPNVTCSAVIAALNAALERGVNVGITTSRRLMRLEQIATAGTTTERCISSMVTRYRQQLDHRADAATTDGTLEAGLVPRASGALTVRYYEPRSLGNARHEPVQSHLKLTVVDDGVAVFGSGNMDRASWFTSQELGVAITSPEVVNQVQHCLTRAMEGRSTLAYDSSEGQA